MSGSAATLDPLDKEYEVVFVDDGSTDGSFAVLEALAARDSRVKVVALRRNYGQTPALQAGIDSRAATSSSPWTATCKTTRPTSRAARQARRGLRRRARRRVEAPGRRRAQAVSRCANWLIRKVTGVDFKDMGCTLRALRRELAQSLPLYGELHRFVPVLVQQCGGRVTQVPVQHHPRVAGKTKYTLSRTFRVVLDLITVKFLHSYITRPMHVFGLAGLSSMAAGAVAFVAVVWMKAPPGHVHDGQSAAPAQRHAGVGGSAIDLAGTDRRDADAHLLREPGQASLPGADHSQRRTTAAARKAA